MRNLSTLGFIAALVIGLFSTASFAGKLPALPAAQETYLFSSKQQQQRFEKITTELRCLVCQNESLADSTAPLAKDLRNEVYQQVQQGADEQGIKDYLVARYGQFILFKPAMNHLTILLWTLPFVLLLLALIIVSLFSKKQKPKTILTLSAEDKKRVNDLLTPKNIRL